MSACLKMPPVCAWTHHDDQQNVLEVISEAQRGAAEQGEVSLQELRDESTDTRSVRFYCLNTQTYKTRRAPTLQALSKLWLGAQTCEL